jgi:hypothetical protein
MNRKTSKEENGALKNLMKLTKFRQTLSRKRERTNKIKDGKEQN